MQVGSGCDGEQLVDEIEFPFDAWLLVVDMTVFDASDGFDAAEGGFGRSQRPKALSVAKQALHRCVIAFDAVVEPPFVNVARWSTPRFTGRPGWG